ncbi:MAG: PD-(D/E)XK nuclease family protein, partial [Anaerolineales bacterium]
MWRLGERHERAHLATFSTVLDLSAETREERERRTQEAVTGGSPVIYQAALRATTTIDTSEVEVIGDPDFLINDSGRYIIRDSKISRRINEKVHPEILRQLELYAWLFEQVFGHAPMRLEVHRGTGDLVEILYDGGRAALEVVREIFRLKQAGTEPYSPVGWTKCGGCGFHGRCWSRAEHNRDIALVNGVDQGLARALYQDGIHTMEEFLSQFNEARLAEYQRPWGKGSQRVGKRAEAIVRNARAIASGSEICIQVPNLPTTSNAVMFD